jgi:hypothetical protein
VLSDLDLRIAGRMDFHHQCHDASWPGVEIAAGCPTGRLPSFESVACALEYLMLILDSFAIARPAFRMCEHQNRRNHLERIRSYARIRK